jgi:UDPglucose--hexose-1-phosphate uridylyltransferase
MIAGTSSSEIVGSGTIRTTRHLADGREIFYYDTVGTDRNSVDHRELHDAPTKTELRRDPLLNEWVVVAGHRQARTYHPPTNECPLCPSTGDQFTEIPESDYEVVVFENRFPSLTSKDAGLLETIDLRPGYGKCEVVCFTSDHESSLALQSPARMKTILDAWMDRDRALSSIDGIEYVFVFENRGVEVGVTLSHPHGQIYGYPFVPPREMQMQSVMKEYRESTGRSLFSDVIESELRDQVRVVHSGENWVGFVPRASRWPFEVQLFPRRDVAHLADLNQAEQNEFSELYVNLLKSLDEILGMQMPYISAWHQAPVHGGHTDTRLFLEVFSLRRAPDKLKFLAGSESAAWVWVNDIAPEQAAEAIRSAQTRLGESSI